MEVSKPCAGACGGARRTITRERKARTSGYFFFLLFDGPVFVFLSSVLRSKVDIDIIQIVRLRGP